MNSQLNSETSKVDFSKPIIFISYSRLDTPIVKQIYMTLNLAGYKPWMDIEDILPGQDWQKQIISAINNSTLFLACLSKNAINNRGMLQVELKEALRVWQSKLTDDIYLIPIRLEDCKVPGELSKFQWLDYYEKNGTSSLFSAIRHQMERLGFYQSIKLRSYPTDMSQELALKSVKDRDFYDRDKNWQGRGIMHQYETIKSEGDELVIDHATSLVWQRAGSLNQLLFSEAEEYIVKLNQKKSSAPVWRLPTLEEALSLMEPKQTQNGLHISSLFDNTQYSIWTSDGSPSLKWMVHYLSGFYAAAPIRQHPYQEYVRAVSTCSKEDYA